MDLNDDQSRITQALHENLHRLQFFMHDMTDEDRNTACLHAIETAIRQVGKEVVDYTMQFLDDSLREKIKAIYQ